MKKYPNKINEIKIARFIPKVRNRSRFALDFKSQLLLHTIDIIQIKIYLNKYPLQL